MSTDIEQLLRDGMERYTSDLSVPAGLAREAVRRHRQRRHAARMAAAVSTATAVGTATAVAAGAVVAGGAGTASPRGGQRLQTTAYVIGRVERALAPSSGQYQLIDYTRTRYSPGFAEAPVPENLILGFGASPRSHFLAGTQTSWEYRTLRRDALVSPSGQPVFDFGLRDTSGVPVTVAVIYRNHTWWRTLRTGPAHETWPNLDNNIATIVGLGYLRRSPSWRATILHDLRTRQYRITGHQRVDGVNALKLAAKGSTARTPDVIWVNPATYLPVRTLNTAVLMPGRHGHAWTEQSDFQWLRPTPANLARFNVRIPAGYTRVKAP